MSKAAILANTKPRRKRKQVHTVHSGDEYGFILEASQGVTGLITGLLTEHKKHGAPTVQFFLDQVPERGEALWLKFLAFKKTQDDGSQIGFNDFFEHVIDQSFPKIFYPKECALDPMTQSLLAGKLREVIQPAAKTNEHILQIYNGSGPVYNLARNVVCKGCVKSGCKHYLPFNSTHRKYPKKW